MATKYIVNNVTSQTITGNLTINGNIIVTGSSNNGGVYRALLTQTGSISGNSSDFNNRLIIGETYEITDFQSGDSFSNVANVISGTVNTTGCVFIATGDTPIIWGNTILTSVGDLVVDVLENTLGDELVWFYDPGFQQGLYFTSFSSYVNNNNLCYIFPRNKTQITTPSFIVPFNYDFYSPPQFNLIVSSGIGYFLGPTDDTIFLSVYDVGTSSFSGNSLYYTPIEIKLNSSITQEDTPLTSINWSTYSGDSDFDTYDIVIPPILNVTRLTTGKCGIATAHVHGDYESSDLTIDLYDNSISQWVTVWSYTLYNQNYDVDDSADLYFPGNIDVTFANITSVGGIRVTSDPGSDQTYHDWEGLVFNFFN